MSALSRLLAFLGFGRSSAVAPAVVQPPAPQPQLVEAPKVAPLPPPPAPPESPGKPPVSGGLNPPPAPPQIPAAGARFAVCLNFVAREEGGYSDHKDDNGGATNLGITIGTLAAWRGKPVTKADVRALTVDEARAIYRANYWNPIRGDDLPPGLDLAMFDWAVNAGPGRAARGLQRLLGVSADGAIGPVTLGALKGRAVPALANELCHERLAFLRGLDDWRVFGKGWTARVERVRAAVAA